AAEVGLGRSLEGRARGDRADRGGLEEPHAGARRARLRRRAGGCRDRRRPGAREIAGLELRAGAGRKRRVGVGKSIYGFRRGGELNGSSTETPVGSKSDTLRVTTVRPC